jgi:aspartyl-tRNA(Asn)/glutamyl-tRNA(Gln) amidotransferase subunit B
VEQYKGGKQTVLGYLVGQVMKATRGQANPAAVNELLKKAME